MTAKTLRILADLYRRERLSLLQYVADSYPWAPAGEEEAWEQVRKTIDNEGAAAGNLFAFLTEHKAAPPYVGTYPASFTAINFTSLDQLLVRLKAAEQQALNVVEKAVPEVDDPVARGLVEGLAELKRRHLQVLEKLSAAHVEPAIR